MEIISRKKAKELGLQFYYTGKMCCKGHDSKRYVSDYKCVECQHDMYRKRYYETAYYEKYKEENKEFILERQRFHYSKNKETILKRRRENNHTKIENNRKRKIRIKKQTPSWYEKNAIQELYRRRKELSIEHGIEYHVDHIIPINHPLVCGLHCLDNLQIIEANDNMRKSNSFSINN